MTPDLYEALDALAAAAAAERATIAAAPRAALPAPYLTVDRTREDLVVDVDAGRHAAELATAMDDHHPTAPQRRRTATRRRALRVA